MNFLRNYRNQIIFLLLGILSGFFIAECKQLHFDDSINPMDFANLILTLFLAVLIGLYIEPKTENKRLEKEMLIEQINEIKLAAKEIHARFEISYNENPLTTESRHEILQLFRKLSNQLSLFLDQANHSKSSLITNQEKIIKKKLFKLKQSITGGAFQTENFTFTLIHFNKYDWAFMKFSKEMNHLKIDINKS